jgi:hypothetical protein
MVESNTPMATGFKSGGRRKGARNKVTTERERRLQAAVAKSIGSNVAFLGDSLELLQSVYKNPHIDLELRVFAARAAIRFERPILAPIAPPSSPEDDSARALRLHDLLRQMRATTGGNGNGNGHPGEA